MDDVPSAGRAVDATARSRELYRYFSPSDYDLLKLDGKPATSPHGVLTSQAQLVLFKLNASRCTIRSDILQDSLRTSVPSDVSMLVSLTATRNTRSQKQQELSTLTIRQSQMKRMTDYGSECVRSSSTPRTTDEPQVVWLEKLSRFYMSQHLVRHAAWCRSTSLLRSPRSRRR